MCIASMPFVFLCSPQEVLCYRNAAAIIHSCRLPFYAPPNGYWCWCAAKIVPFPLLWKLWKTGIRFKIWSLIGQYLEICVCPWEPARTFCCHFRRLFHWLIGPKLICVNDFVFSIFFFCCLPLLAHSDHLCIFRVRCMVMVRMWAGSCVGVHGFLWCDLVVGVLLSWVHVFSVISVVLVSVFVWCSEFEGCSWFVFPVLLWCE